MTCFVFRKLAGMIVAGALVSMPAIALADSLEGEIELLRSDIKSGKIEVVKNVLGDLPSAKADAFWPVYRQYQSDLDKIGDKRLALIKDYAANYDHMTDAKAKSLVNQALDLQSQRTDLLKKYYKNFDKVLGSVDAAKLVQTESVINALIDVQLGADLPLMQKPAATP